jgi:hypothetical protein
VKLSATDQDLLVNIQVFFLFLFIAAGTVGLVLLMGISEFAHHDPEGFRSMQYRKLDSTPNSG